MELNMQFELNAIVQGAALPILAFFLADYVRFRFQKPWVSDASCKERRKSCDEKTECDTDRLDDLKDHINGRLDRLEKRLDRVDGLIMNLARPPKKGVYGGFSDSHKPIETIE